MQKVYLFCSFSCFFSNFFFWLVLAKFFGVFNHLFLAIISLLNPSRELDACSSKQLNNTWCWLCAVVEVFLSKLYLYVSVFSMGVVGANISNNTTT